MRRRVPSRPLGPRPIEANWVDDLPDLLPQPSRDERRLNGVLGQVDVAQDPTRDRHASVADRLRKGVEGLLVTCLARSTDARCTSPSIPGLSARSGRDDMGESSGKARGSIWLVGESERRRRSPSPSATGRTSILGRGRPGWAAHVLLLLAMDQGISNVADSTMARSSATSSAGVRA
jgi:hypothetical protein